MLSLRLTRPDRRPGTDVEIISWLDDCTRCALHVTAHHHPEIPHTLPDADAKNLDALNRIRHAPLHD